MGKWSSPSSDNNNGWEFNSLDKIMRRKGSGETMPLFWNKDINNFNFSNNKNYLIRTQIKNIKSLLSKELSIRTVWNILFENPLINSSYSEDDGYLNFYSKPDSFRENRTSHSYTAKDSFTNNKGILDVNVSEIDWSIIGFSWINNGSIDYSTSTHGLGWNFIEKTFGWLYHPNDGIDPGTYLNNNLTINSAYKKINCLSSYVSAQRFNIQFDYSSVGGKIEIYLSELPPYDGINIQLFDNFLESSNKILSLSNTENGKSEPNLLLSLVGGQYIIIVAFPIEDSQTANIKISNLKLSSNYHPENNKLHNIDENYEVNIQSATYSAIVGDKEGKYLDISDNSNDRQIPVIKSKIGNGYFDLGVWENGVWNSGWRKDENVTELFDIDFNIKVFSDFKWHIRINGLKEKIEKFKVGDLISVGNIVAIDVNEQRKQLIDPYKIVKIESSDSDSGSDYNLSFITIEIETTFPLRRIQKDSESHRIKITKNIWLSGAFFNGYFSGVWNFGLFRGYPLISEMSDTHWKDGFYEGGRFNSKYIKEENRFTSTFFDDTKLGLETLNKHSLKIGDSITINKNKKEVNSMYDTTTKIIKIISKNKIVTDIDYNIKEDNESGIFLNYISDSVIQNMQFKSENVSKITSNTSLSSTSVFNYNSWINVNYLDSVAINIGKNQNLLDPISKRSYSENNLFGYETLDVLSSISEFRNSYSLEKNKYKLGTKFKIFKNYLGDSGIFNEYFDTKDDIENFLLQGWTFSIATGSEINYSRTLDKGDINIIGQELMITSKYKGGILDIINNNDIIIDNRQNTDIEKNRYTKIEFDLVKNDSESNIYVYDDKIEEPILHFNNINKIQRESNMVFNTALPIYENVNLLNIDNDKKVEYFYNKKHLSMYLSGNGKNGETESSVIIKNFKFLETDMIPFFKYFTEDTINKSIQIPYQGIAPFIDYENVNFVFLDNIKVGLDSVISINTYDVFTGSGESAGAIEGTTPPTEDQKLQPTPEEEPQEKPTVGVEYSSKDLGSITIYVTLTSAISENINFDVNVDYNTGNNTAPERRSVMVNINSGETIGSSTIDVYLYNENNNDFNFNGSNSQSNNIEILKTCIFSVSKPELVTISPDLSCDLISSPVMQ